MGEHIRSQTPTTLGSDIVEIDTGLGRVAVEFEQSGATDTGPNGTTAGIIKVHGMKYAEIAYRWADPRETGPWLGLKACTQLGPGCPQISRPLFDVADIPLFGRLSKNAILIKPDMVDEFNCLNLNIWVPVAAKGNLDGVAMKTRLLVLVWVHGGSYMVGADGGFNLYDGTELARRSIKLNMPMIVVTFNYRVGILGYLHSCKLAEKVSMQTDIPLCFRSTANLGLLDAHMAFDWVMKHIHDFGGDPENIYGIGESAQAGILNYLALILGLHLKIPQIILSSSTCFSVELIQSKEAESWYNRIYKKLNISPNATNTVNQLRTVTLRI